MKELIKDLKFIITACKSSEVDLRIEQLITDFVNEQKTKQLIIDGVMCSKNVLNEYYTAHNMYHTMMKETEPLSRQYFEAYGRREGFRNAIEILTGEEM